MIAIPTVLVLGAGASQHCYYPLGRELVSSLCRMRGTPELRNLPNSWDGMAEEFLTTLSFSDPSSIDAFLERNRAQGELGKYLIALELKKHEYVESLFPPNDAGWYRYLFDVLVSDGEPNFAQSDLTIVTFNYDRSLEAYFLKRLQVQFQIVEAEAVRILSELRIIHVHGILGEIPKHPYQPAAESTELLEISRKLQIIHELNDSEGTFCNSMFREANERLQNARRIYFLGFGFHLDNIRRFQFFSPEATAGKLLRATANGLGAMDLVRLKKVLLPLGFPSDAFSGSDCNNFFKNIADL